jgi:hypothetical protein
LFVLHQQGIDSQRREGRKWVTALNSNMVGCIEKEGGKGRTSSWDEEKLEIKSSALYLCMNERREEKLERHHSEKGGKFSQRK